jgi:NAD(P)-dependent dehydrogenase (short-subunit alcohol dehydrogenase family)
MAVSTHGLDAHMDAAVHSALAEMDERIVVIGSVVETGSSLDALPSADWDLVIIGLRQAFFALRDAAASMGADGGSIIVIVPVHAMRTSAGAGAASVTGSFLTTVAEVAAAELGERGIRVNVVAAGPLIGEAGERVADAVPLGRLTTPDDVASVCRMLCSADAAHVTGAVVPVDGGYQITKAGGGSPFAG